MTNRYHLPLVVTTTDEMSRDETIEYVERILANLEETDEIYRTYVEDDGIGEVEAERLLNMLEELDPETLDDAYYTIDSLEEDE